MTKEVDLIVRGSGKTSDILKLDQGLKFLGELQISHFQTFLGESSSLLRSSFPFPRVLAKNNHRGYRSNHSSPKRNSPRPHPQRRPWQPSDLEIERSHYARIEDIPRPLLTREPVPTVLRDWGNLSDLLKLDQGLKFLEEKRRTLLPWSDCLLSKV